VFHFKKFSIDDSRAAMKIGTDSVLLGAWTPCGNESRILDIGTGSGILALMMAQRNHNTPIDAVEIEDEAALLAEENISLSPWASQIAVFNTSLQEFRVNTSHEYSLIICNPPYFTNSLKAPDKIRNMARHNDTLPVLELLEITSGLLTKKGKAAFILPADVFENWSTIAAKYLLYPTLVTLLKSSINHQPHRVMAVFSKNGEAEIFQTEICIYSSKNIYSDAYRELTKEFYLNF
jgi:tRNA1Val (adenine37-N6)-methyltransferase